jgi:hypothetical protein
MSGCSILIGAHCVEAVFFPWNLSSSVFAAAVGFHYQEMCWQSMEPAHNAEPSANPLISPVPMEITRASCDP